MQGGINPEVPEGTQASVFAIFDEGKKLQFVGFSKDLRNSLRTVFGRRPDKAFFYKCAPPVPCPGAAALLSKYRVLRRFKPALLT
jgi:hypothetical protein